MVYWVVFSDFLPEFLLFALIVSELNLAGERDLHLTERSADFTGAEAAPAAAAGGGQRAGGLHWYQLSLYP